MKGLIVMRKKIDNYTLSCSPRCHNAKTKKCACICLGAYHGVANRPSEYKNMCDELGLQVPESPTPD